MTRCAPDTRRALLWAALALLSAQGAAAHYNAVLSWPALSAPLGPADPDAWLRLTQVRQWIDGGMAGFFDHAVRHANAPFGGIVTPWTRPMDMLLALFYSFMPAGLAENARLMLAATWLPPVLGLGAIFFLTRAAGGGFHAIALAALLLFFTPEAAHHFAAGNADHHGLLCMLWCGVIAMLMAQDTRLRSGAGALLGLMVWVSPEGLLAAGVVFAALGAEGLFRPARMGGLFRCAVSAAAVATFGMFIETPWQSVLARETYDTLSIVQAALLWLVAAVALDLSALYRRDLGFGRRLLAAVAGACAVAAAMWLLYPKFFHGPMVDADPFIVREFLPHVGEAHSLASAGAGVVITLLLETALAAALLGAVVKRRTLNPERRRRAATLLACLAAGFALTCLQVRWNYYLFPPVIASLAWMLPPLTARLRGLPRTGWGYAAVFAVFVAANALLRLAPPAKGDEALNCIAQTRYVLQTGQLQKLLGEKTLVLFTHEDAGGEAQFFTPYGIIASNYHREGQGLKDMRLIYTAAPGTAKKTLEGRKAGAMLFCPALTPPGSWLRGMGADKHPRWMTPVKGLSFMKMPGPVPQLFRVARK